MPITLTIKPQLENCVFEHIEHICNITLLFQTMQIYLHYNWTQFKRKNAILHFFTKKARLNGTYYDT